uniref:Uncharacterized protein n=1 Tax=Rhizophora mucronata TaxID=61149 RepID=A0A2P2NCH0_RHIMU
MPISCRGTLDTNYTRLPFGRMGDTIWMQL